VEHYEPDHTTCADVGTRRRRNVSLLRERLQSEVCAG